MSLPANVIAFRPLRPLCIIPVDEQFDIPRHRHEILLDKSGDTDVPIAIVGLALCGLMLWAGWVLGSAIWLIIQ